MSQDALRTYLASALGELERLTAHIRENGELNRENEIYFLLRELVSEQIGAVQGENTGHPDHPPR